MKLFVQKHSETIMGNLSGFDRLVFRGTLRSLAYPEGMRSYLSRSGILLKDFSGHVAETTARVKKACTAVAEREGRPVIYLESGRESKEEKAREILKRDKIQEGLVCVFSTVELCRSYDIYRNRKMQKLELVSRWRKCLHFYQYWVDSIFGFMNARLQTWFPFSIQICLNGREWLSRQMDRAGLLYVRRDNCFPRINDVKKAHALMDRQGKVNWVSQLDRIARRLNPAHEKIFEERKLSYYWSAFQSEWATDVMFRDKQSLDAIYPSLIHHGMTTFQSPDVFRFLGQKLPTTGAVHRRFAGEVGSDLKIRHEGVRVKHRINRNSLKIYNKEGSLLRVETTINDPCDFKVYRSKEGHDGRKREWLPMRKGIADLHRRTQVSQAANSRYLDALALVDVPSPLKDLANPILHPTQWNGRRVRAINPWFEEDARLLESVLRGEFTLSGFRNRDLRPLLFPSAPSKEEQRRQSARVSRKLRLLRAHHLIKKVPHSHRYQLTDTGRRILPALMAARNADASQLTQIAA